MTFFTFFSEESLKEKKKNKTANKRERKKEKKRNILLRLSALVVRVPLNRDPIIWMKAILSVKWLWSQILSLWFWEKRHNEKYTSQGWDALKKRAYYG